MRKKSIITGIRYLCGGKLSTRLYDKRDDFDFHIVNFPFLSSNIPSSPSYGVYISQLIRYTTCLLFVFLILVGVELPPCIFITLFWNAVTCFLELG